VFENLFCFFPGEFELVADHPLIEHFGSRALPPFRRAKLAPLAGFCDPTLDVPVHAAVALLLHDNMRYE
jgi:hypothetical protein